MNLKKKNTLKIFEENVKLKEMNGDENLIIIIQEENAEIETKLKEYTIKFNDFFVCSKEIKLSNNIGDSLKIPAKCPILSRSEIFQIWENNR